MHVSYLPTEVITE